MVESGTDERYGARDLDEDETAIENASEVIEDPPLEECVLEGDGDVLVTTGANHVGPFGRPRRGDSRQAWMQTQKAADVTWEVTVHPESTSQQPTPAEFQKGTAKNLVGQADSLRLARVMSALARIDGVKVPGCREEPTPLPVSLMANGKFLMPNSFRSIKRAWASGPSFTDAVLPVPVSVPLILLPVAVGVLALKLRFSQISWT